MIDFTLVMDTLKFLIPSVFTLLFPVFGYKSVLVFANLWMLLIAAFAAVAILFLVRENKEGKE